MIDPVATFSAEQVDAATCADVLVRAALQHADRDALVFPDSRWSYADLLGAAARFARGLCALGLRPREHVGLLMANSPECVSALFGTWLAGCVAVPINTRFRTH